MKPITRTSRPGPVMAQFYADLSAGADPTEIIGLDKEGSDPSLSSDLWVQIFSKQRSSGCYGFCTVMQDPFPS